MEYRQLYAMQERPSLLGFGCMRLPLLPGGDRGDIDYDRAQAMIDEAIAAASIILTRRMVIWRGRAKYLWGRP